MKLWHIAMLVSIPLAACAGEESSRGDADASHNDSRPAATSSVTASKTPAPVPCTTANQATVKTVPVAPKHEEEKQVHRDAELTVKRLVIAKGIKSREPVEAGQRFEMGERLYAFVEVGNQDQLESEIYVRFKRPDDKPSGRIRLRVGESPRWRTWAYTRLVNAPGVWEAVVVDGDGDVLARQKFEIIERGATEVSKAEPPAVPPRTLPAQPAAPAATLQPS